MAETPPPNLTRALLAGLVLAGLGVALFLLIFFGLGNAGMDDLPRLLLAMLLPPVILAVLIAGYWLLSRR